MVVAVRQLPSSVWSQAVISRTAAHQASLSLTISRSLPKFMFIASVMPSNHLILWCPLPLLPYSLSHQGLFQWVGCLHQVTKILELQFLLFRGGQTTLMYGPIKTVTKGALALQKESRMLLSEKKQKKRSKQAGHLNIYTTQRLPCVASVHFHLPFPCTKANGRAALSPAHVSP